MIKMSKEKQSEGLNGNVGDYSFANGFMSTLVATKMFNEYNRLKKSKLIKLEGGKEEMNTKSRYEVISELEETKRGLIREKENLGEKLLEKKKQLKELKRDVEDKEEEIKEFESSMKESKETIDTLVKSVDESLNRFASLNEKK